MAEIKNIHLLTDHSSGDLEKMEAAAIVHRKINGITFKVVEYSDKKVIFQIVQSKHPAGHYFPARRLVEIVHETFDRFFQEQRVIVQPIPFRESPANKVDPAWIRKRMERDHIKIKDIAEDTGIDRTQLNALITGNRPLSQPMKALFWLYFQVKNMERA